jgi:uncharacterized membrane protein YbhN (UPF0104 family)
LLVSAIILYFVLRKLDWMAMKNLAWKSNPFWVLPACLFFVLSKVLSAYRLNVFFRARSIHIPAKMNVRLYWLGMFYNLFLPGGIGGDGYKVVFLRKRLKLAPRKLLTVIIMDRLTGMLALVLLCMIFLLLLPEPPVNRWLVAGGMLIMIVVFYGMVFKGFKSFFSILNRTNLQSLGVQLLQVVAAYLLLKAMGHSGAVLPYLFVFLVSSVVAVIPFTIGGVGAREATFLMAARWLALDVEISVAISLLFFLITAVVSLWGIVYTIEPEKMITASSSPSEEGNRISRPVETDA